MLTTNDGLLCEGGCEAIRPAAGWTLPNVIAPGTGVRGGDRIEAVVIAVMIENTSRLQYQVAYWNDRVRVTEWLDDCEVALADPQTQPIAIGFLAAIKATPLRFTP